MMKFPQGFHWFKQQSSFLIVCQPTKLQEQYFVVYSLSLSLYLYTNSRDKGISKAHAEEAIKSVAEAVPKTAKRGGKLTLVGFGTKRAQNDQRCKKM